MAEWYYYNENDEKIGPMRGRELRQLVQEGTVTPNTRVEDKHGQIALAKHVKGLPFHETAKPDTVSSEASSVMLSPPTEVNPFTASMPTGHNPFVVSMPAKPAAVNPFADPPVPVVENNRLSLGEMITSMTRSVMTLTASMVAFVLNLIASMTAFILVMLLCGFVALVLLWLYYIMHPDFPPPGWLMPMMPVSTKQEPTDKEDAIETPATTPTEHRTEIHATRISLAILLFPSRVKIATLPTWKVPILVVRR